MAGWRQAPVNRLSWAPGSITDLLWSHLHYNQTLSHSGHITLQSDSVTLASRHVGGHRSLVSSGAGNVFTESQSGSPSEARLTVVTPIIIFRPATQATHLPRQPGLTRQRHQREAASGTNQRWRRPHRFTEDRGGRVRSGPGLVRADNSGL